MARLFVEQPLASPGSAKKLLTDLTSARTLKVSFRGCQIGQTLSGGEVALGRLHGLQK